MSILFYILFMRKVFQLSMSKITFYSEKDAQMCMYHISWQSNYGFCCELDDECARELAGMYSMYSMLHLI